MRPDKHPTAKALHHIPIRIEFQNRIQVRIGTPVTKVLGSGGIATNDCPWASTTKKELQGERGNTSHFKIVRCVALRQPRLSDRYDFDGSSLN